MIKSMIFNEKNHDFSQKKPLIGFLEPKISIWIGLQRDGRDTRAFADGRIAPGAPKSPGGGAARSRTEPWGLKH